MGFFKVNVDEESVKDFVAGDTKYIRNSGMHELIIKKLIVDESEGGSQFVNLLVTYNGQDQPIFQAFTLTNKNGSTNLGARVLNKLMVIANIEETSDLVEEEVPIGKANANKICNVIPDFEDLPVVMNINMEYSMYNGKIQKKKIIRNVFRVPDYATAAEILNEKEVGEQYKKELETCTIPTLKNVTMEDVELYEKNVGKTPKEEETKKSPTSFGKKKAFGK